MAMYVFKDNEKIKKVFARDLTKRDKELRYYCPNKKCSAKMYLWSLEGESRPFFRSAGEPGHIDHCPYGTDNKFVPENNCENGFDSDSAISDMMNPTINKASGNSDGNGHGENDSVKEVIPHTIKQIYDMCKYFDCDAEFNHKKIGQILVDDRSIYMYPNGVFGLRLVEAKCRSYLYEDKSIFLVSTIIREEYEFELKCSDDLLFRSIRDLLYANRDNVIVVAGQWEKSGVYNRFSTQFNSKKQIKVLKQKI